jgi:hypothetical protein
VYFLAQKEEAHRRNSYLRWQLGVKILIVGFVWLSYLKCEVTISYRKINEFVCMIFLYVEVREMISI